MNSRRHLIHLGKPVYSQNRMRISLLVFPSLVTYHPTCILPSFHLTTKCHLQVLHALAWLRRDRDTRKNLVSLPSGNPYLMGPLSLGDQDSRVCLCSGSESAYISTNLQPVQSFTTLFKALEGLLEQFVHHITAFIKQITDFKKTLLWHWYCSLKPSGIVKTIYSTSLSCQVLSTLLTSSSGEVMKIFHVHNALMHTFCQCAEW